MTGFEPGSSGIGSDRSANCATTTAQIDAKLKTENVFASSSLENCLLIGRTDGRTHTRLPALQKEIHLIIIRILQALNFPFIDKKGGLKETLERACIWGH